MDGWMDGWLDGWMTGWVDEWMDGQELDKGVELGPFCDLSARSVSA